MLRSLTESKEAAMLHRFDNGGGLFLLQYLKPLEHKPDNCEKAISRKREENGAYINLFIIVKYTYTV